MEACWPKEINHMFGSNIEILIFENELACDQSARGYVQR